MSRRPNTQDISWFIDQRNINQLNLKPPYQRRSVWTPKDRRFFLDTIFRDYPSPAIFLHKSTDENNKNIYNVVDGRQRLETIFQFVDNKISIDRDFGDDALNGKKWKDLENEPSLKKRFWDYVISVEMIDNIDGTLIESVFDRLNRNARKLARQELRHAKFDGWLIQLAEAESEKQEWKDLGIVTSGRAKRMIDVQFISELLLVIIEKDQFGFDQNHLDDMYAKYDDSENLPGFSEEVIITLLENTKRFLIDLQNFNGCIKEYANTFNNFYTLWAVVYLYKDSIGEIRDIATRYTDFMTKVEHIRKLEDVEDIITTTASEPQYALASRYYENSRGASTDLAQRKGRSKELKNALGIDE